jgi:hypothetical protein
VSDTSDTSDTTDAHRVAIGTDTPQFHLLRQLKFPARYEGLIERVGAEVVRLLVQPADATKEQIQRASLAIAARNEGLFGPMFAESGTGKTTLASNLTRFFPADFAPTVAHHGEVSAESLLGSAALAARDLPASDERIVVINVDDRESDPPSSEELAALKRFLRHPDGGIRSLVLWPETSKETAADMADRFRNIAGIPPIELPLVVEGPPRETWPGIAVDTLRLANHQLEGLEHLGVDLQQYEPDQFRTLGDFLRAMADDFTSFVLKLLLDAQIPVSLMILFASESPNAGVLSQVTNHAQFGLVDARALVDATKDSEIGRWWSGRPGLLIQTIVLLNVRAYCLPPSASIPVLRRFGPPELVEMLTTVGVDQRSLKEMIGSLERTDVGRFLRGTGQATFEARGTPADTATAAFQLLAEQGFTAGKDKPLNKTMRDAWSAFITAHELPYTTSVAEAKLPHAPLVPDNSFISGEQIACMEYTWRSGDYLTKGHRAEVSAYILAKLRSYARELGWVQD